MQVYCSNVCHITPWTVTLGLLQGAARCLRPGGRLLVYGPFNVDGQFTSDGNRRFDATLKQRDPTWGVRDVGDEAAKAAEFGLQLRERIDMPANNFTLVLQKGGSAGAGGD